MSFITVQNGAPSALVLPHSAVECAERRTDVESLADLLTHLSSQPTSQTPMLRTTAAKIAAFLGKSVDEISLDLVHASREGFRPFLETQRYKEGSVRSYVNYLRMLLEAAAELGWKPFASLPREWVPVLTLAKTSRCLTLMKSLAQTKKSPEEITQQDLDHWIHLSVEQGKRYASAQGEVNGAWRTLVACGYVKNAPFPFLRKKYYGVPLSKLPVLLKQEVAELLRWKSADFEPDRPKRAQIRKVSAFNIERTICSLYGYATNIAKLGEIESLELLIQKPVIAGFISWCINEQKLKGGPMVPALAAVLAAVSKHPAHKALDLSWSRPLLETVPTDSYEEVKARKAKKYLDYEVLESIPAKIHAKRNAEAKRGKEHVARSVMEELMISWLLVLPWRQRNLREFRVAGPNPNLFKAKVPAFSYIDMPSWARQAEADNPNAEFWQIRFSPDETKTKVAVHCLVPRQLIGLLEEYLLEYRPLLLRGKKYDTLFIPPEADEMNTSFVTLTVSELTLRYGGRRVTPHLFRDIVAFAWLKAHPADYLTLSKLLWHKNIATTIKYYAGRFNESSAVVAMESWLDERGKKGK